MTRLPEDFYDDNLVMRNIAALLGIGVHRLKFVGGSLSRRRLVAPRDTVAPLRLIGA